MINITEPRRCALVSARAGRLFKVGTCWKRRGVTRGYGDRTIIPMVRAGLLVEVCGSLELSPVGRNRLAELESRR